METLIPGKTVYYLPGTGLMIDFYGLADLLELDTLKLRTTVPFEAKLYSSMAELTQMLGVMQTNLLSRTLTGLEAAKVMFILNRVRAQAHREAEKQRPLLSRIDQVLKELEERTKSEFLSTHPRPDPGSPDAQKWTENLDDVSTRLDSLGWFCIEQTPIILNGLRVHEVRGSLRIFRDTREHRGGIEKIHSAIRLLLVGPYLFVVEKQDHHDAFWKETEETRSVTHLDDTTFDESVFADDLSYHQIIEQIQTILRGVAEQPAPATFNVVLGDPEPGLETIKFLLKKRKPGETLSYYRRNFMITGPLTLPEFADLFPQGLNELLLDAQAKAFYKGKKTVGRKKNRD